MSAENHQVGKEGGVAPDHTDDGLTRHMTAEDVAKAAARFGYGPLAHVDPNVATQPAFGGEAQPGRYRPVEGRKFANPAPLGLCGFALTTFILSIINMGARGLTTPNIVVGCAFGYGGLVQLCAGMWEMAVGNTFGATALSSYGGFWISLGIILTPGGFKIEVEEGGQFLSAFGIYLMGWFIFTTLMLFLTFKSTVAFFLIFFTLDLAFLLLGIAYLRPNGAEPNSACLKAGGLFGLLAAFSAWYNAFAGIADTSNSFFIAPVVHFPWSDTGKSRRQNLKTDREVA